MTKNEFTQQLQRKPYMGEPIAVVETPYELKFSHSGFEIHLKIDKRLVSILNNKLEHEWYYFPDLVVDYIEHGVVRKHTVLCVKDRNWEDLNPILFNGLVEPVKTKIILWLETNAVVVSLSKLPDDQIPLHQPPLSTKIGLMGKIKNKFRPVYFTADGVDYYRDEFV